MYNWVKRKVFGKSYHPEHKVDQLNGGEHGEIILGEE